jgi:hypothetical protein
MSNGPELIFRFESLRARARAPRIRQSPDDSMHHPFFFPAYV